MQVEVSNNTDGARWHSPAQMMVGAAFGLGSVLLMGAASADGTPSSLPAQPDTLLAPAVVVAAGADTLNPNVVDRLIAHSVRGTESGTAFHLEDGRIGSVAHALIDARSVTIGDDRSLVYSLDDEGVSVAPEHDLATFPDRSDRGGLRIATEYPVVGDKVAAAGFARDERLSIDLGTVVYRGPGSAYGISQPDIFVISSRVDAGWSGGPVVDAAGDVVAVIVGQEINSGVAIAVPIQYLPEL
ncbi:MAG: serine protease [Acidimicrobiales bacterium]|nr:MAG: serine protease [Acidimicrobiales bacterium]